MLERFGQRCQTSLGVASWQRARAESEGSDVCRWRNGIDWLRSGLCPDCDSEFHQLISASRVTRAKSIDRAGQGGFRVTLADWSEFKEQVRSATDLVSLVRESRAVTPRRGNRELVCLCPFHDDRNPSCTINAERQSYKCWSCNAGGDCFSWVMRLENVDFREALELLAQRAGLELPRQGRGTAGGGAADRKTQLAALTWAQQLFHECLLRDPHAAPARDYLTERGFGPEVWRQFALGFHPEDWRWLLNKAGSRFSQEVLLATRLIGKSERATEPFDYFVGRVMFPIHNTRGDCVAFGGRVLPGRDQSGMGKYFNSPESPLFSKSRLLYGLSQAKDAIREQGWAIVVEGYTDCIALHQNGLRNAVGSLGTALTDDHAALLKRFTNRVVVIFDGDDAGQAAAERALPRLIPHDLDLRILTLPGGQDPAEYVRDQGVESLRILATGAGDAWNYKLDVLIRRHGLESLFGRERIQEEMLELLRLMPRVSATAKEDILLARLARRLQVSEDRLRQTLENRRNPAAMIAPTPPAAPGGTTADASARESAARAAAWDAACQELFQDRLRPDDRLIREAIEVILAESHWYMEVMERFASDEIANPVLRACWRTMSLIAPDQEIPRSATGWTDDERLKSVLIALEHSALGKGYAEQLAPQGGQRPRMLEDLLSAWVLVEARRDYERQAGESPVAEGASRRLDSAAEELLRKATELHRLRAVQRLDS